jgi:rhodanese-related sulfurtransferase
MTNRAIVQDLLGVWVLMTACIIAGLTINEIRSTPLPLVYSSPQMRLNQSVGELEHAPSVSVRLDRDVDRKEMQQISTGHLTLILDARPEIFFRLGHIPSALSLPRDDFENRYHVLQTTLESYRDKPMVVYCSSSDCPDSQMVAEALQKLGYQHVRLFRGGWNEWESANLPEEKE